MDEDGDEHIDIDNDDDDDEQYSDVEGAGVGLADGMDEMGEEDMEGEEGVAIDDDDEGMDDEAVEMPQQDARIVNITKNDANTRSEEVLAHEARQSDKAGNDPILVVYNQQ